MTTAPEGASGDLAALPVAALDLGSTRIKGAVADLRGGVRSPRVRSCPAPPARTGPRARCESDPHAYLDAALRMLRDLQQEAGGPVRLGLASQRSSFVLWQCRDGRAVTPLISWRDRRASAWCERQRSHEPEIRRRTGLPLSPHYAGPKLAVLLEEQPDLRDGLAGGELRFGTLDSFLLWHAAAHEHARMHATDLTMAARTLLCDPGTRRWSGESLALFGVPLPALPRIAPSVGVPAPLEGGGALCATLADQAAAALALIGTDPGAAAVNLGTGGFVVRPAQRRPEPSPGYLAAPLLGPRGAGEPWALEGTITGVGAALARFGSTPVELPVADPAPEAFSIPDVDGIGSPHWRAACGPSLSPAARDLDAAGKRRTVVEGVIFRVREILEDLFPDDRPGRIVLAGGPSGDPGLVRALAAGLDLPLELARMAEATLAGAAGLAAGAAGAAGPARLPTQRIEPSDTAAAYLRDKYHRWRRWAHEGS